MDKPEEPDEAHIFSQQFWDERYAAHDRVWSGRPNPRLVEHATELPPGLALDVGCGEGADVVWLAEHGWRATNCFCCGAFWSLMALRRHRRARPPTSAFEVAIGGKADKTLEALKCPFLTHLGHRPAFHIAVAKRSQPYERTRLSRYDAIS